MSVITNASSVCVAGVVIDLRMAIKMHARHDLPRTPPVRVNRVVLVHGLTPAMTGPVVPVFPAVSVVPRRRGRKCGIAATSGTTNGRPEVAELPAPPAIDEQPVADGLGQGLLIVARSAAD